MERVSAVSVPLSVWQDPQGDVVLHHSLKECMIYFGCWLDSGEPADYVGTILFRRAFAVRGRYSEFLPYLIESKNRSEIYIIENSKWLTELIEEPSPYQSSLSRTHRPEYFHYVVKGHDNYYEIIAAGYEEGVLPLEQTGELARLISEA